MSKILKTELQRSFQNKLFVISLLISMALVLWYSIERLPACLEKNATFGMDLMADDFLEISFTNWIGSHNIYLQQNIFYIIFPLLATLPFGGSFYSDINDGYIKNICIRIKKEEYLLSKYIAVFVSGGMAVVIPMIGSFLISAAYLPTMLPESSYAFTNIVSVNKWANLFFTFPFAYFLIYSLMMFIFSGFIACMSLMISYFSSKSFLPLVFPFFIYIFLSLTFEILNLNGYSIRNLLTTTDEYSTTLSVLVMCVLLFVLSFVPYYMIGVKKDVFAFEK